MQTRLTVRVDRLWIEPAKRYAEKHGTTLSKLISEYLRLLSRPELSTPETPILHLLLQERRLLATIPH